MCSKGFLPPPGCTAPDGSPAWGIDGLAALFDMQTQEFLRMMAQRPPAYQEEKGIPSMWWMLESA